MTDSSSQPLAAVATSDRMRAARRRRERKRLIVSVGMWVFVLGNLVGILWILGSGGGDGVGYHWHSFDELPARAGAADRASWPATSR